MIDDIGCNVKSEIARVLHHLACAIIVATHLTNMYDLPVTCDSGRTSCQWIRYAHHKACPTVLRIQEHTLQDLFRHLPFALVVFLLAVLGMTDQVVGAEPRVLVTLLAPMLWLGLYLLFGSSRATSKE